MGACTCRDSTTTNLLAEPFQRQNLITSSWLCLQNHEVDPDYCCCLCPAGAKLQSAFCRFYSCFVSMFSQAMCAVALDVEVRLESYSNPDTKECGGGHCETFPTLEGICDHMFSFCVRAVGSEDCLTSTITSQYIQKDRLTFSQDELNTLGISNPLHFSGITSTVNHYR